MTRIELAALETAIANELAEYVKDTAEMMREVVEEVTDESIETLKATSPRKSGSYAKGWKSKATIDASTGLTKTIHNRTPGLTHLLENGHAKSSGGRVEGIKHIAPVEKQAIQSLELQLPVAYHHFEEGSRPSPPYLVYLVTDSDNHGADNWTYHKQNNLQVELYTIKKDLAAEEKVESLFDSHLIYFEKVETYISSEKLYQITYYITLHGG